MCQYLRPFDYKFVEPSALITIPTAINARLATLRGGAAERLLSNSNDDSNDDDDYDDDDDDDDDDDGLSTENSLNECLHTLYVISQEFLHTCDRCNRRSCPHRPQPGAHL